ncbi:MAG: pyrroline-5-carboxylate reductase [Clostridia bacterium]|nr:pyrroline-5-carboxylate reductase [Clostridia bacterium]
MKYTFGFIGTGNMGSALALAVAKKAGGSSIAVANRTVQKAQKLADQTGAAVTDNRDIAENCKYIFLGVKPQMMAAMLEDIRDIIQRRKDEVVLVSMAAGLTVDKIAHMAGGDVAVVRIMPNTPVAIGKGVTLYCSNSRVSDECEAFVADAISESGFVDKIDENLINIGNTLAGCGPAFAEIFAEALADGAVACGLPRAKAVDYAAKMLEGTASLMLASGKHTGQLKDEVCSPGGSTIRGVQALENGGFRAAAMNAVIAAFDKTNQLGK